MPGYGKSFQARRGGETCGDCGKVINAGQMVRYRYEGPRVLCHTDCASVVFMSPEVQAQYNLHGGSGYGCRGWQQGQVVRNPMWNRRNESSPVDSVAGDPQKDSEPEWLYVLSASSRYVREDGMSFGVGDERGYVYSARCRAATPEEYASCEKERQHKELKLRAQRALAKLAKEVCEEGERPEGTNNTPVGDVWFDSRNVYGGGDYWVIESESLRKFPHQPQALEKARCEYDLKVAALDTARKHLIVWTEEHLPIDAPTRRQNGGRAPHNGFIYGKDLDTLTHEDREVYLQLEQEVRRLSEVNSPDSFHRAQRFLQELELRERLGQYPRSIWYVRNNGADGDDWSLNNVRTGGAGAIGFRVSWNEGLFAKLLAIKDVLGDTLTEEVRERECSALLDDVLANRVVEG